MIKSVKHKRNHDEFKQSLLIPVNCHSCISQHGHPVHLEVNPRGVRQIAEKYCLVVC